MKSKLFKPLTAERWNTTQQLILAGVLLAIALFLPFLTGQIRSIGSMLLPMHFPAFIAAYLLGPVWGLVVGAVSPLLRNALFGMPPMPMAGMMAFEMAAYAFVAGIINNYLFHKRRDTSQLFRILLSLICAMIVGRLVYALASWAIIGRVWTFQGFLASTVIGSWPGIVLQIVLIPLIVRAVEQSQGIARK